MSERTHERSEEYLTVAPVREELDGPCLEWITIEHPDEKYLLGADDSVLDTYYNPEFDAWEALVLLAPTDEEER